MSEERPFGGGGRAPYVPQYGSANLFLIAREAGLDPLKYATEDFIGAGGGMGALYELFSDGEIIEHQVDKPFLAVAPPEVRHGEFYSKLAALRQRVRNEPGSALDIEMNKLARFCGIIYAGEALRGRLPIGASSEVQATIDQRGAGINYAGYRLRIEPQSIIMDIGPGVVGKQFIELQARLLERGQIFQYLAISNGPFVNQFLLEYGKHVFNRNPSLRGYFNRLIELGFLTGREDGFSSALAELLFTPQPSGRHDFADVVICNGLGGADGEELRAGLSQIHRLVKPGGHLLLGSSVERAHDTGLSFDEQLALVSENFDVVTQVTRKSGLAIIRRETESTFAVLQRKATSPRNSFVV